MIVSATNKDIVEFHQNLPVLPKKTGTPGYLKGYISNVFLYQSNQVPVQQIPASTRGTELSS